MKDGIQQQWGEKKTNKTIVKMLANNNKHSFVFKNKVELKL